MLNRFFKRRQRDYEINPDEIFLDTANVSGLDQQQFEGVFEKPLNKRSLIVALILVVVIFTLFLGRLISLQILQGDHYFAVSENNRLRHIPVFAKRGVIYDRNNRIIRNTISNLSTIDITLKDDEGRDAILTNNKIKITLDIYSRVYNNSYSI